MSAPTIDHSMLRRRTMKAIAEGVTLDPGAYRATTADPHVIVVGLRNADGWHYAKGDPMPMRTAEAAVKAFPVSADQVAFCRAVGDPELDRYPHLGRAG